MVVTRVGYAGGRNDNPTYHNLQGHTEVLQLLYDPNVITYDDLLDLFWRSHNPTRPSFSEQYKSVIFFADETQRRQAEASKAEREAKAGRTLHTDILPAPTFWPAEDYHQKYMLRRTPRLAQEYEAIYPDPAAFRDSTAVARVNAYVAGYAEPAEVQRALPELGLSPEGERALLATVRSRL